VFFASWRHRDHFPFVEFDLHRIVVGQQFQLGG
jgi:hypothetical protein